MSFWSTKRVLITGGAGFLGSFVVEKLRQRGCKDIFVPRRKDYDLVEMEAVKRIHKDTQPNIVIHLAARVGGIGANQANPGKFFYDNLMMGAQLMEVGRQAGVEKFVTISTICAYPKFTPVPFKEKISGMAIPRKPTRRMASPRRCSSSSPRPIVSNMGSTQLCCSL